MLIHNLRWCPNIKQRVVITITVHSPACIFVLHKNKSIVTQIKDAEPMLFYAGLTFYKMDQL